MEKLARALSVIQQGMLRNNPGHVKDSVSEATEVLSGMLTTHKCLLESGVEIQKRPESHPASKRMGIFRRPSSASLGDTPKKLTKGRRGFPLLPRGANPKERKGQHIALLCRGHQRPDPTKGWGMAAGGKKEEKKKKNKKKKEREVPAPSAQEPKENERCHGAPQPPGLAALSGCRRRTVSLTLRS